MSYGKESPMKAPKAQSYGTRPSLHNRADTFASTFNKDEKYFVSTYLL